MLSLRIMASVPNFTPLKNGAPVSKGAIFIGEFSRRSSFSGKMRLSNRYQKKVELAMFDSFRGGGVAGVEEDDLRFANQTMERLEATLNRMSKWLVSSLFAIAIIWWHDPVTIWAAIGTLVNSLLSTILKKFLNQERPSALRTDPGMPSSHAQLIFYAVFYSIYSLMEWMGVNLFSVVGGAAIFIIGTYLSWLRVSQQLHTISQVFVGAILGSVCCSIWLWIWRLFVLRAFDSSIMVRAILLLGAATFYVTYIFYVIHQWHQP